MSAQFELRKLNLETRSPSAGCISRLDEADQLFRGESREDVERATEIRIFFKLRLEFQQDVFECDCPHQGVRCFDAHSRESIGLMT